MLRNLTHAAAALFLAAAAHAAAPPAYVTAAVADPARPAADRARDAERKPAATLAFSGVKPGAIRPGAGPGPWLLHAAPQRGGRFRRPRIRHRGAAHGCRRSPGPPRTRRCRRSPPMPHYANVTVTGRALLRADGRARPAGRPGVDVARTTTTSTTSRTVDVCWTSTRQCCEALKPGGVFVVHRSRRRGRFRRRATPTTLHRIDPQAGEEARSRPRASSSTARATRCATPDDPHTAKVFDDSIRGHTDQFMMRFRKLR